MIDQEMVKRYQQEVPELTLEQIHEMIPHILRMKANVEHRMVFARERRAKRKQEERKQKRIVRKALVSVYMRQKRWDRMDEVTRQKSIDRYYRKIARKKPPESM